MRWLLLLGAVAAMAVAAWWFWPRDELAAVAPRPAAPSPTPLVAELPVAPAPIPTVAEPSAPEQDAGPRDAGVIVHAIFEQVGSDGRVAGTRFFLSHDGGTATGLADMMGFARVDVPQGSWVVTCSNNCGHNYLAIVPGYEHFILPTVMTLTVNGSVVDDSGAPVAGALVWESGSDLLARGVSTRSRPDGTFSVVTEEQTLTLQASKDDADSVPVSISLPAERSVVLQVRQWVLVSFDFPNFKNEPVAMLSIVGQRPLRYTVGERRRTRLPVGEHEAVARTWKNNETYTARGHFTVTRDKWRNHVQLVLGREPGLRVNVTDTHGQPLSSVTVFASRVTKPGLPIDAGCALVVNDAGVRCARELDPNALMGSTDGSGLFEVTPPPMQTNPENVRLLGSLWDDLPPESEVEPMYTITLGGSWREQSPALMKLGDEPITLVAVPR